MKFIILKSKNGQFYFTLNGKNGQVVMTSETYTRKHSCIKTICSIIKKLHNPVSEIEFVDNTKKKKRVKTNMILG